VSLRSDRALRERLDEATSAAVVNFRAALLHLSWIMAGVRGRKLAFQVGLIGFRQVASFAQHFASM